jgi:integrase
LELTDLRCAGLAFRITANGTRSWAFRFRDPKTGNSTRATIGTYPDVGLGEARAKADGLRQTVAAGDNPVELKRVKRSTAKERSFAAVAERFMVEHSRRHKRSSDGDDRNLNLHVLPRWKNRQIEDIRRPDVIALVETLIQAGTPVLANRVHSLISSIFSFALDNELVGANPCARLKKRGEEGIGTRILSDEEVCLFWKRSVLSPVSRATGLALRLELLTGTRPSEAAEPALSEFRDLDNPSAAAWHIPGARTKNKRDHLVPLSAMALETVRAALELVDDKAKFLFPSPVNGDSPIDGHSLAVAMRRLSESEKLEGPGSNTWKADPPSPHDLRRTFATRLSALGVSKEDRDACMNHIPTDVGSRHYDLYQRAKEKRAAVERWAAELQRILSEKTQSVAKSVRN